MSGTMVQFPTNGRTTQGYLATPAAGKGPGLLVIQEWWGLVPHIKHVCDRFAAEGFSALAPDMYHGETASEPDTAGKLFMALSISQAEKDLSGAAKYLSGHSSTAKLGAVGFCMGGQLALFAAATSPDLVSSCVDFYGAHPKANPPLENLQAPLLGIFAEVDGYITPEFIEDLDRRLTGLGKPHEFHTYPGTEHGFFNDETDHHHPEAARDSWRRTLEFLRRNVV